MKKQTVKVRIHKPKTFEWNSTEAEMIEVPAIYVAGDWAVTPIDPKNPNRRGRGFRYVLTHIPTGMAAGKFSTQKTAKACCREVAKLPCDAEINIFGKYIWPHSRTQSIPIAEVFARWKESAE